MNTLLFLIIFVASETSVFLLKNKSFLTVQQKLFISIISNKKQNLLHLLR